MSQPDNKKLQLQLLEAAMKAYPYAVVENLDDDEAGRERDTTLMDLVFKKYLDGRSRRSPFGQTVWKYQPTLQTPRRIEQLRKELGVANP